MGTRLVRVTHPFHPLSGRQLGCVGERYNRYGTRLLLRVDEDRVCSVPRQWTDVVAPDPEVVIGGGRSLFRVADLLELADLVLRLVAQEQRARTVRRMMPLVSGQLCRTQPRSRSRRNHWTAVRQRGDANALDSRIEAA